MERTNAIPKCQLTSQALSAFIIQKDDDPWIGGSCIFTAGGLKIPPQKISFKEIMQQMRQNNSTVLKRKIVI